MSREVLGQEHSISQEQALDVGLTGGDGGCESRLGATDLAGSRLVKSPSKIMAFSQRGMATAEYAVGILAAVALALVLLKIFQSTGFLTEFTRFVKGLLQSAQAMIK